MSSCLELHCLELPHACIAPSLTAPEHGVCVCAQRDVHKAVNNFKADIKQGKTFRDVAHEKRVKNEFRASSAFSTAAQACTQAALQQSCLSECICSCCQPLWPSAGAECWWWVLDCLYSSQDT